MKSLIFDMDGVILDSEPIYRVAWQQAASQFGYELDDELYLSIAGRRIDEAKSVFIERWGRGFPFEQVLRKRIEIWQDSTSTIIPLMAGVHELLDYFDQKAVPKAIATSTYYAETNRVLSKANILHRFEVVVTGDQVRHGKPAPDVYLLASKKLHIPPAECMVIEDTGIGIQAAFQAGMIPILIDGLQHPSYTTLSQTYRVISSLDEVKAIFEIAP